MRIQPPPICAHCGEPIEEPQIAWGPFDGSPLHSECRGRLLLGGLNHFRRLCRCYGGSLPPDPPGLSRREAAQAVYDAYFGGPVPMLAPGERL